MVHEGSVNRMGKGKKLYIHTIGCQMNHYDTEQMAKRLASSGYGTTPFLERADLIITNTCCIREKAEQKVYSFLGRLVRLKETNPDLIIGVSGCVAQQEGAAILGRVPQLDFVLGTHAIGRLPEIILRIERQRSPVVDVEVSATIDDFVTSTDRTEGDRVTAFVTIMRGCDNHCTYCVVPAVRGREMSRAPEKIVDEIQCLVGSGVREVTLLGQNVNSYGKKEGLCAFHELLALLNDVDGLWRIRFTTSHPKDLSDDLIRCFGDLDTLCHHIHLPVQSGSNRILKLMNRKYTREQYLEKVGKLRRTCPDIAITSDIIVGFPGETPADFEQTLELIKVIEYDSLFMFRYSDRPRTPASRFSGTISEQEKKARFDALLSLQEQLTAKKHQVLVGSTLPVLTEGWSKRQHESRADGHRSTVQWSGRTSTHRVVNFVQDLPPADHEDLRGTMVDVKIMRALPHSLEGISVDVCSRPRGLGEEEANVT